MGPTPLPAALPRAVLGALAREPLPLGTVVNSPKFRVSRRGPPSLTTALPRPALGALRKGRGLWQHLKAAPRSGFWRKGRHLRPSSYLSRAPVSIPRARIYPARPHLSRAPAYIPRVGHPAPVSPRQDQSHQRPHGPHMAHAARGQNPRPGIGGYRPFYHLMPIAHRLLLSLIRPAATRTKTRQYAPDQPRRKLFRIGKRIDRFWLHPASPSQPPKPRTVA